MSELNYITEMLELKDNNIKFYENCYHKKKLREYIIKFLMVFLPISLFVVKNVELSLIIILKSMVLSLQILKSLMFLDSNLFLD